MFCADVKTLQPCILPWYYCYCLLHNFWDRDECLYCFDLHSSEGITSKYAYNFRTVVIGNTYDADILFFMLIYTPEKVCYRGKPSIICLNHSFCLASFVLNITLEAVRACVMYQLTI